MLRKLSDEEVAANWAYVRRRARLYFWLAMIPGLAAIWAAGYAYGLLDHCAVAIRETISMKESNQ